MAEFYEDSHRALQDEFQSRALADRLEQFIVKDHLEENAAAFIERSRFCFLSTVNGEGFPSTSFKGGGPGFIKQLDERTLLMPCFDGNGMWRSAGNVESHNKVGLLFIDFEAPERLRLEGTATLTREAAHINQWPEVALAIKISISAVWVNCPRYIPTMQVVSYSNDAPEPGVDTPEPAWKTVEGLADVVPPRPHNVKDR